MMFPIHTAMKVAALKKDGAREIVKDYIYK